MKKILIILAVILLAVFGYRFYLASQDHYDTEVHVHSDFAVYVNNQKLDFSQDKYQSSAGHEKNEHIHVHDKNGNVVHRHAEGVTFAEFLHSLGFMLTNDCFTLDTGEEFCTDASTTVALYVNGKEVKDKTGYINQEKDRILLTVGTAGATIDEELASVTDEACVHSGTCPERGVPPVETCGLTCDVTLSHSHTTLWQKLTYVFFNHY